MQSALRQLFEEGYAALFAALSAVESDAIAHVVDRPFVYAERSMSKEPHAKVDFQPALESERLVLDPCCRTTPTGRLYFGRTNDSTPSFPSSTPPTCAFWSSVIEGWLPAALPMAAKRGSTGSRVTRRAANTWPRSRSPSVRIRRPASLISPSFRIGAAAMRFRPVRAPFAG